jgi:hypothetical protein
MQQRAISSYKQENLSYPGDAAAWSSPDPNGGVGDDDGRSGEGPDAAAEAATRHLRAGASGRSRLAWARGGRRRPGPRPLQASMRPEQSIAGDTLPARNR